jgi:hypothetical protein
MTVSPSLCRLRMVGTSGFVSRALKGLITVSMNSSREL